MSLQNVKNLPVAFAGISSLFSIGFYAVASRVLTQVFWLVC